MSFVFRSIAAGTALLTFSNAVSAELSAEDVWADWTSYVQSFGYGITGQANATNTGLTIAGVTLTLADPDTPGGAVISMDQIVMTENADGTVSIDLPTLMPMEIAIPTETGVADRISMDYRQTGLEIIASGTAEALQYEYSADNVTLAATGFEMDGQLLPADSNQIQVELDTIAGTSSAAADSLRRYTQNVTVSAVRYTRKTSDPVSGATSDMTGQWQNVVFDGESALPLRQIEAQNMDALLAAGLSVAGTFTYSANASTVALSTPEETEEVSIVSGSGEFGVALAQDGVAYEVMQRDTTVQATIPQMPLPLNFDIEETSLNISLPVRRSETSENFAFGFEFAGFSMADTLWDMFDPGQQMPRGPATVALDLTGKAKLLFNLLDPTAVAEIGQQDAPAELEAVNINRLEIDLSGANLSGTGAFEFENVAGAPPKPIGSIDLSLVGGNRLLDRLVASGLLPEDQAMGARMMMGLLAVPGDAPDTLNSKLEINAEGHVLANGQRIQ